MGITEGVGSGEVFIDGVAETHAASEGYNVAA